MNRGDIWNVDFPAGTHPAVIVTRETAIPVLRNVTVAMITSTVRSIPTEVPLGPEHGLARECAANADNLFTVPKRELTQRRGALGPADLRRLDDALRLALGLD